MIQRGRNEERRMRQEDQRRREEHEAHMLAFMEELSRAHLEFQNRLIDVIASLKD